MTAVPTIFALSTPPGRGAIAIFRVSGTGAAFALERLGGARPTEARRARRVTLRDPETGEVLDEGLALWFPGPGSYTGEDLIELHIHGGPAVVEAVGLALGRLDLRPAAPGEFTRRAFLAGKLDLTQVEAVADLIDAETEAQRRQAQRQAGGALTALYDRWRDALIRSLAHFEAYIDFPDEDLPPESAAMIGDAVDGVAGEIAAHLVDGRRGERLRAGVAIAVVGPPNVGKSSFINMLAQRDVAIVSPRSGTTRDVIEVHLDLGGYPAVIADTAGLREAVDPVEQEGVARALARARNADLKLVMLDAREADTPGPAIMALIDADAIVALNKIDLADAALPATLGGRPAYPVSVATGSGVASVIEALGVAVEARAGLGAAPALTRTRHRLDLEACLQALRRAADQPVAELKAEDLRAAVSALGRITGRAGVEDLLDVIFRDFCIGK